MTLPDLRILPASGLLALSSLAPAETPHEMDDLVVSSRADHPTLGRKEGDFALPLPGGRGFQDVLPLLPNVQQGSPSSTAFTMRGLGQDNVIFLLGTQSNTLLNFSDGGAPQTASSLTSVTPLMWDIGEVRVTRGPVLFGRGVNAAGGEIRLEPNAPQFFHEGKATVELADYGSWRVGLTENMELIPEKLALRVSAASEGTHNAVTNLYDGNERFAETRRENFRGQLRWRPAGNEQSVFDLRVDLDRGRGNFFGQAYQLPGRDIFDRVVNVNDTATLPADRHAFVLRGRVELDDGWWVESESSYSKLDGTHFNDFDGSPLLDWFYVYTADETRLTESLRVGREGEGFRWLAGIYAEAAEYEFSFKGRGLGPVPAGRRFESVTTEEIGIAAAYGHGELELGRDIWLTGGLRLDHQSRDQVSAAQISGALRGRDEVDVSSTEWLPELGLEWRGDALTTGAKISRAYRPGGAAVAPSLGTSQAYGPERGWELNLFAEHQGEHLRSTVRAFHAWMDGQQVPYVAPGGFPVVDSFITNSGKSQRAGVEVEMEWRKGNFAAGASAGYLHTEFDELVVNGVNRSGQAFPLAPEWNAALGIGWRPATGWFGEMTVQWADTSYAQIDSTAATKLEARTLLSARTGYRWQQVDAYVFGSNLLDEEYALSKNDYTAVGLPVSGKLGMPCVIGTGVTIKW
ncbi:TonB-dependent receptor [Luteolibacter flavescens]|uniref:TonB-dependent receptor n=1 Tax=Luteolibacter flavescens TaxID=1859460 RepID=A0ABT3FVY4_9BACT|nr:TonB-dependent receptor [Luteolibacter flavescens]MCW1887389.1 TonB-dependent receptor [Luteolibacter flavescens]